MSKCVVFNTVNGDGVGDFSHFEDIMKALLANPAFISMEFIPIVCFLPSGKESNYIRIGEKLRALGIPFFYGKPNDHEHFSQEVSLQKNLREASQAIIISFDAIFGQYSRYLRQGIPIKIIGEHDPVITGSHDLGLSRRCYGIKIKNDSRISQDQALRIIADNNPEFSDQLLSRTISADFDTFNHNNSLIPAYFNIDEHFISFLHFLGINDSLPKDKNFVIYHSGSNLSKLLRLTQFIHYLFDKSYIGKIELILPTESESRVLYSNPLKLQTIKIFSGFYLNDLSYDAIFQLTKVAGVSGDNTFERCFSMNVLPYYYSSNMDIKKDTLLELRRIIRRPEIPISSEARNAYLVFFSADNLINRIDEPYKNHLKTTEDSSILIDDPFTTLNVQKMTDEWPIVCEYFRLNFNFYNHLERIIREDKPFNPQAELRKEKYKQTLFQPPKRPKISDSKFNEDNAKENTVEATDLWQAASKGELDTIKRLARGANLDQLNDTGCSPFWLAACKGHIDVVTMLYELGADINKSNEESATPLFIAAQMGRLDVVNFLIAHQAKILPFITNRASLCRFAEIFFGTKIMTKINQFIQKKSIPGSSNLKIHIMPDEIAFIMGHDEIVEVFHKTFQQENSRSLVGKSA
jgi:ankyrin repeat protein